MPWPYPAVNIGDINNLDAVFAPGLHLLETSGEDVVSAFINRHIVMPRLNVVDFVCNRIDPAVFITTTIFPDSLPESMVYQLQVYLHQRSGPLGECRPLTRYMFARNIMILFERQHRGRGCRVILRVHGLSYFNPVNTGLVLVLQCSVDGLGLYPDSL